MSSDPYSAIIGGLIGTGSSIVQAIGIEKQYDAEEEAAQAAALLAREQALIEADASRRRARREIGTQRGMIARSGVSLQGSQMDVLLSNAREMELEAVMIERFGAEAARQKDREAKSIAEGKKFGRAAGLIKTFQVGGSVAYEALGKGLGSGRTTTSNPGLARNVSSQAGKAASESQARLDRLMGTPLGPGGGGKR